jgi:hypothetical protein
LRPTYTVYSPIDEGCTYGRELTVTEAADAMLTAGGAYYELCGDLWRGSWELWVASPEDVAGGRIGCEMTQGAVPANPLPLSEAWPEIADLVLHADLLPHVPSVATDDDYLAMIEPMES